jgi:hypothetical protein
MYNCTRTIEVGGVGVFSSGRVPHSFALFANEWDSTVMSG